MPLADELRPTPQPQKTKQRLRPNKSDYVDRRFRGSRDEYQRALARSRTLYIGNLSFYTTEEQVYELFRLAAPVRRVIMGLDATRRTPCGFCFVEYVTRKGAEAAVHHLNGTLLDGRALRVDYDYGFEEGRQYGRGKSGGQVRDEFRDDYDPGRGGYGRWFEREFVGGGGGGGGLAGGAAGGGGMRSQSAGARGGGREDDDGGGGGGKRRRMGFGGSDPIR